MTRVNSHRLIDGALNLKIVSGHDHLVAIVGGSFRKVDGDRDIRGSQEHLRAVVAMESSVASPFLLSKDIKRSEEFIMSLGSAGLDDNHATTDLFTLNTTEQNSRVVTRLGSVKFLLEGFEASNDGLDWDILIPDKFNFLALLEDTTFNTTSSNSPTPRDGENVYKRSAQGFGIECSWLGHHKPSTAIRKGLSRSR